MTRLGDLLSVDNIQVDVDVASGQDVLEYLAKLLARRYGGASKAITDALAARERLGSTALGHGVALPHARIRALPGDCAAFVRTRAPIPFDAPDARNVQCFLGLLVPAHATERHLQLVAQAGELLGNPVFREALRRESTAADVARLFAQRAAAQ